MKKNILILIIAGLVAAGGAYFYYSPLAVKQAPLEVVLPGDTVSMVKICELTRQIERFKGDRMGQSLAKMDIPGIMNLLEISPEDQNQIFRFKEEIQNMLDSAWFDILFGQEIALAVQPLSLDLNKIEEFDIQELLDATVIVGRPRQPARVLESLNSMFSTQLDIQSQAYKQWEINQFTLENDLPVYYALADGLLIAGMSLDLVQRCLDQSLDAASSLLQSKAYKAHCADLFKAGETDLILYGDLRYLMDTAHKIVSTQAENKPDMVVLKRQLEEMQGLETINLACYDDGGSLVQSKLVVSFDRSRMSPTLAKAFSVKPGDNPTLQYVPAKVLVYSWQNNLDLNLYWQKFLKSPEIGPEKVEQIKQEFSRNVGVELEQFLAAFGSQVGFLINDVNTNGMFPIPELALQLETFQPETVEQAIGNLVNQFGMPLQKASYNGAEIMFVALPLGADLSPAYVCKDGFCTIAVNKRLLESMLDSPEKGNLGDQKNFKEVDKGLSKANNQISYMNVEGMIAKSYEVISWAMAWMAATQPDKGEKAQKVVELVVNPLLDGFSMFKAIGSRTYSGEGHMTTDVYTSVQRP
jgi:Protein of unknown function (DUF3352)